MSSYDNNSSSNSFVSQHEELKHVAIAEHEVPSRSGKDPPGQCHSVGKGNSSCSSFEGNKEDGDDEEEEDRGSSRRRRVARRKGQKKAPTRKTRLERAEAELGESFQLSFSNHSHDNQQVMNTFAPFENSFEVFDASATIQWTEAAAPSSSGMSVANNTVCTAADMKLQLYTLAQEHRWDEVASFCRSNPWAAKHVDAEDGTTVLHLAVMSRANPFLRGTAIERAPLDLIEALVAACPEAAIVRCSLKRYTPLCYVCLVSERDYDLEDACRMAKILLSAAPHCSMVFTDEGYSALDIHIISYSKIHSEKAEMYSAKGRSSTLLLRTLLKRCPDLVESRPYGQRKKSAIEILYRCNLDEFKSASGVDTLISSSTSRKHRTTPTCLSVASTICDWWAWRWTETLLEASWKRSRNGSSSSRGFQVVHAAAQIVGCPVAVLSLTMDAFPEQIQQRGNNEKRNSPLHEVCGWVTDDVLVSGDSFVQKRKSKAIAALLQAYPSAVRMTNGLGETPLQLAVETCTPWDGGLGALALAFPKALLIQRSLEHMEDNSPLMEAIALQDDDLGSVGHDADECAVEAIRGMYPFLVAAALSHVSERKIRSTTSHSDHSAAQANEKVQNQLKRKDLDSLSSIYGLLRTRPQALQLYLQYNAATRQQADDTASSFSSSDDSGDEDSADESTEALSLSDLVGHS